jgi:hypothetical protein
MHGDDPEAIRWFFKDILFGEHLHVYSNKIGDDIGVIKVLYTVE